jgi:allophanate hydrolase
MDFAAYEIAHAALDVEMGSAIEVSLGGLALECVEGAVTIAVAGGGFLVSLDSGPFGSWLVATIRAGSRLSIRPGPWGSWTYLAFAGRLQSSAWLGSASTHLISGFGGGRLSSGQLLTVEDAEMRQERVAEIPCPVWARPREKMGVVLGPQERFFPPEAIDRLLSEAYALTDSYDRMGVRLAGPLLKPSAALDMPSEGLSKGSIQVAGDGVPTILLADHQTTGGYPKIATVASHQLDGLAQHRSRQSIRFTSVTPRDAIEAGRTRRRMQEIYLGRLRAGWE